MRNLIYRWFIAWLFRLALFKWAIKQIQRTLIWIARQGPVPGHVAFIMDGNRRYAKKEGLARTVEGHSAGFEGLKHTMEWCYELGMKAVTVYAFSMENFNRTPEEVSMLMGLAIEKFNYMAQESDLVRQYGVRIRVLGELGRLPEPVRQAALNAMEMTKHNTERIVNICFPYTSKAELASASNAFLESVSAGLRSPQDLTKEAFSAGLYTGPASPPVDIMVRTSGERRLSEFLTWQLCESGAQLEFLPVLWPDFGFWHFLPILLRYQVERMDLRPKRLTMM